MNQDKLIYFKTQNKYFSINAKECYKIVPFLDSSIICKNTVISNDVKINNFIYCDNELISVFNLSSIYQLQVSTPISHIIIIVIDNKKIGLEVALDEIFIHNNMSKPLLHIEAKMILGSHKI